MRTPLVILGSSGFSREVLNWIDHRRFEVLAFYSDDAQAYETILRVPVLNSFEGLESSEYVCGVGSPELKLLLSQKAEASGLKPCRPIIHRSSTIGTKVNLAPGAVICPNAVITTDCEIGEHFALNLNSTVGHDCKIGKFVTISPGVNLSGNCKVGDLAYLGTGSCVRERISIGERSVLGMGAVLVKDLPSGETWGGVPARLLKK